MTRHLCASAFLAVLSLAIPLRAATRPHVGKSRQRPVVWTNDDLKTLHTLGLISIVGRMDEESPMPASLRERYVKTQDPEWYGAEAAKLRDELEQRQAQLREYRLALDDARSLKETTGGLSFDNGEIGITPEAGIEMLQQGVNEAQTELGALEDLARKDDIPPGTLRGR